MSIYSKPKDDTIGQVDEKQNGKKAMMEEGIAIRGDQGISMMNQDKRDVQGLEYMNLFFEPSSIAVVGASDREGSVGRTIMENLLGSQKKRVIYPINPKKKKLFKLDAYPDITSLPEIPDLLIIATPARTVPGLIEEGGKKGINAAVIISAGFKEIGEEGKGLETKILKTAKNYGMRIIGPNCMGLIRPSSDLNTTFTKKTARPGSIAFLSQSGALGTAVLDWAINRDIGFSVFVSLGSMLDVDFGDLIDYFGQDPQTKSIIIYLESLGNELLNARKFMSAARGFARSKPVILLKPGKFQESRKAASSHTGSMLSEDFYYDAAFARAGVVRVEEISDLFNCASILNTSKLPKKPNLAIVTNAGGPAVLATDALMGRKGKLSELGQQTYDELNKFLSPYWSHANPLDILGDATPQMYGDTLKIVLNDPAVHGAVVLYTPQGPGSAEEVAQAIIDVARKTEKPVLTAMLGSKDVMAARRLFYENSIPTYEFPEEAVKTYLYMYHYSRGLESLYETPVDLPLRMGVPKNYLKVLARSETRKKQTLLNEVDSKKFLSTYGISVTRPHLAADESEARRKASNIGYPVVMKISSPDISHKSDVGGVILNINSDAELELAYKKMMDDVKNNMPGAHIDGVTLQSMVQNPDYELIVGAKKDPVLGVVILFGLGGTEAEFYKDINVGLPPLNQILAHRLLEGTNTYKLLSKGYRSKPPVSLNMLEEILIRVSNLIIDFHEIKELDINPLSIKNDKAVAVDARIILDETVEKNDIEDYSHLIISPYPTKYVQPWTCKNGRLLNLRPIKPEDEPLEAELLSNLSPDSSRFRFFITLKLINHDMLTRFCNIDYDREIAIIAEYVNEGKRRNVGVGRLIMDYNKDSAEYAVLVADDFQGEGLGLKLSDVLIGVARDKGLKTIYGIVLKDNVKMIGLCRKLGFSILPYSLDEMKVVLEL
jgi:acetyltransferase